MAIVLVACKTKEPVVTQAPVELIDSVGWWWEKDCPENLTQAKATAETESPIRLHFYGWNDNEDSLFAIQMPKVGNCRRVLLEYTMCGWNQGPADWDMTTEVRILDPRDSTWYELQRAFTPYGGSFSSSWKKVFYMDVTHYLPLLTAEESVKFKIFYCGWDATDTKAHALKLKFYFFEGENQYGNVIGMQNVYNSLTSGNNGYRAWAYGVASAPIESDERLGLRTIQLPEGTKHALLRVCITGHGQEVSTASDYDDGKYNGYFPGRSKKASNPAEFDENWYTVVYNGNPLEKRGHIWEINQNGKNYTQAGTYKYNRAGWGPGKPGNTQYWMINDIPADGRITLDLNLDEYISDRNEPNAAYVANYYVMADIFAYDK